MKGRISTFGGALFSRFHRSGDKSHTRGACREKESDCLARGGGGEGEAISKGFFVSDQSVPEWMGSLTSLKGKRRTLTSHQSEGRGSTGLMLKKLARKNRGKKKPLND